MKYKIGQEVMTESEGKGTIEAIDDSQQIPLYFVYFPHLKIALLKDIRFLMKDS